MSNSTADNSVNKRFSVRRQAILNEVKARKDHPCAEDVYNALKGRFPGLSLSTVYRNLREQVANGELISFYLCGRERFDGDTVSHCHFVCESCNSLFDFSEANILDSMENAPGKAGKFNIIVYGRCKACLNKNL